MTKIQFRRQAFSFVEIMVATGVGLLFFAGIIFFASSTRVETSKAENYLRALQIAQETLELVQAVPASEISNSRVQVFEGSLVDPSTHKSSKIPVHQSSTLQPTTKSYPEEYSKAWFYRKIDVSSVPSGIPNGKFLKKVTVTVFWNENKTPAHIEGVGAEDERMRKLTLSTLLFDETEVY